jgi:hypothetical protein
MATLVLMRQADYHSTKENDMEEHERMMAVLEGSCPDCDVNLVYKEYGGTVDFLEQHFLRLPDFVADIEAKLKNDQGRGTLGYAFYEEACKEMAKFRTVDGPGGTAMFQVPDGIEVTLWLDNVPNDRGMIVTTCPKCKKQYEAYYHVNGDWNVV